MSRRTPLIVLGAVLLAFATFVVLAGVVLMAAFGSGKAIATGPHPVTTSTRALVFPVAEINGLSHAPSVLGRARIEVEATKRTGDAGVFAAVGPAADVDRYLAGADVDLVTDVEVLPFRLTTRHRPGTGTLTAPGTQNLWVAHSEASSGTARLSWPIQDGNYRVVFMNADGSPAVDVDGRFSVVLPSAAGISLTVLASGFGIALVGAVALTLGLLARRSEGTQPPSVSPVPPSVPAPVRGGSSSGVPTAGGPSNAHEARTPMPERSPR
jgi:hypothetical protein